ncbi:hypothetical protein SDC9_65872 [bioreactor metagenome]|uniref:Uncharacterized protein n=1 Tax=bioreactor metagenome TaxID=1076179 RepID=A0A644XUJ7_9ZZZZ
MTVHTGGPGRDVRDRVPSGVHAVRGTNHQRDGLGFDLADAAMLPRLVVVGIVHHNVRQLVREGLDLRGRVHVRPDRDRARLVVGDAVRAEDHAIVLHAQHLEPGHANLPRQPLPEPRRRFTFQQRRRGRDREWFAVGLRGVPHIRGACADHPGVHHLAGLRLLPRPQPPPRARIGRRRRGEPARDGREDHVPGLSLHHLPAQALPLPVPGDQRRERLRYSARLERGLMLRPDQHRVVERTATEPGRERQRLPPVIARDQCFDSAGQLLVQLVELRLPGRPGVLVRCHDPASSSVSRDASARGGTPSRWARTPAAMP